MSKIALVAINSKYIHSNLAVYSLKAYCTQNIRQGCQIEILEYTINQHRDAILRGIYTQKPRIVAFSCYIWNISLVLELAGTLKKILPDCDIWLGGPEVSFRAESFLQEHPEIDLILVGEGEASFSELAELYGSEEEPSPEQLSRIKGITTRNGYTGDRELLSLDELPFVYETMEPFENRIIYYESSRGCPFGCSYCLSSIDKKLRFKSLPKVFHELSILLEHKVPQVKFVDRTFNADRERTRQLLQFILENDNGVTNFHFEIAADLMTSEEISILQKMRPGLVQLEIGVQSTNPDTIREIHRVTDLDRVKAVVEQIRRQGNIHQHLDLIAGLPMEDLKSFERSFDEVYRMRPNQLQLGFLKVLKGTYMEQMQENYELVYQDKEPFEVLSTKWLSYQEILWLKRIEEMVEVYYNSGQYAHTLRYLETFFDSPYALYSYLAGFYENGGFFEKNHTRITRYTLLQACFEEYLMKQGQEEAVECLKGLLIMDLYLRENLKTRPAFAPGVEQKETIKELLGQYKKEITGYLHIEAFSPNVLRQAGFLTDETVSAPVFVLFDYTRRDPLNHNAKLEILQQ